MPIKFYTVFRHYMDHILNMEIQLNVLNLSSFGEKKILIVI